MLRKERMMKRLILLFVLLLSCVSLCRYAYPPVPVVYGFLTDDYMDPNPASIAWRQMIQHYFSDEREEDEDRRYPDWYGGTYYGRLSDVPNGKLYLVIQIVRGHSYMEDEIHKIMAQVENAGYAFEYVSVSYEKLYRLSQKIREDIDRAWNRFEEDGRRDDLRNISWLIDDIDSAESKIKLMVYDINDLSDKTIYFLGFPKYLEYLFNPYITVCEYVEFFYWIFDE